MLYELLKIRGDVKSFRKVCSLFIKDECREFGQEDLKKAKEIGGRKYF
jgi:hypothetical protein